MVFKHKSLWSAAPRQEDVHFGSPQAAVPGCQLACSELGLEGGQRSLPLTGKDHLQTQGAAQVRQLQHGVALF